MRRREVLGGVAGLALCCAGCSARDAAEVVVALESEPTGFGNLQLLGPVEEVLDDIEFANGFGYYPQARAWLVRYPVEKVDEALATYPAALHEGLFAGFLGIYQKCPHLGCRVPECNPTQRFECPCHGSQYSQVGEYLAGPAPRGMDLFALQIVDGELWIDTSEIIEGLPIGIEIVGDTGDGQESCLGESSH